MTQLQPTNLFAIKVDKDATEFKIVDVGEIDLVGIKNGIVVFICSMPFEGGVVIGTCTNETIDFDVEPFVDKDEMTGVINADGWFEGIYSYKDYVNGFYMMLNPMDSFRSLLRANGITDYEKLVIIQKL